MTKLKLNLLDDAYPDGDSLPDGTKFKNGIYSQNAVDERGVKYQISWKVIDPPREEDNWDESTCCDWDNPSEIYCYPTPPDEEYPDGFKIGDCGKLENVEFKLSKNGKQAIIKKGCVT